MKTCRRFAAIREGYQRDIDYLSAHSERHAGTTAAKASATHALSAKSRMAKALNDHVSRCLACG